MLITLTTDFGTSDSYVAQVKGELCEFALSANDDAKLVLGLGNARRELPIKVAQINVGDTINYNDTDAMILAIVPRKPVVHIVRFWWHGVNPTSSLCLCRGRRS